MFSYALLIVNVKLNSLDKTLETQIELLPFWYLLYDMGRRVNEQLQRDIMQRSIIPSNRKFKFL